MSDKHIIEEENSDMNKTGKVIAGVVIAAGASLAVVGGVYAYNRNHVAPNEPPKAITSVVSGSSSSKASSSFDKSSAEASRASSISAENSSSASLSMQAQAEAAAKAAEEARKAEEERLAAEAAAKAAEEEAARQAAARAAEEAERAAQEEARRQQPEPVYEEPSYEPDPEPEPTPSQGGGNQSTGGNDGYVVYDGERGYTAEENTQAQAEGYQDAAEKRYMEENGYSIPTDDDLKAWGLL